MTKQNTKTSSKTTYSYVHENRCPVDDCRAIKKLQETISLLQNNLSQKDAIINSLEKENFHLKGKINQLNHRIFAPSSERTPKEEHVEEIDENNSDKESKEPKPTNPDSENEINQKPKTSKKRKRGAKKGHKGYGRKIPKELPTEIIEHEIPEEEKICPECCSPYRDITITEDSIEIDCKVIVTKTIHKRKKAVKTCDCKDVPTFVTASKPPQVIPKSMFSNSFWANTLVNKYYLQIPLNRQNELWKMSGLDVNQSTLIGGFKKLMHLFKPLYERLIEISRQDIKWHADETRWMVFDIIPEKENYRWWLWTFITDQVVIYILDPSRSSEVPKKFFKNIDSGKIVVDRYSSYYCLDDHLTRCLCWSHLRRDFINAQKYSKQLDAWAQSWIDDIFQIRTINDSRVEAYKNNDLHSFNEQHDLLSIKMNEFINKAEKELENPALIDKQLTILKSLKRNWEHYSVFINDPDIPMDNNLAERMLRNPALGRKVYYGHHAQWSGEFLSYVYEHF